MYQKKLFLGLEGFSYFFIFDLDTIYVSFLILFFRDYFRLVIVECR